MAHSVIDILTHYADGPALFIPFDWHSRFLGVGFKLIESMNYIYRMPSGGLRPYGYARFQKIDS